jgi:hypothetical protein
MSSLLHSSNIREIQKRRISKLLTQRFFLLRHNNSLNESIIKLKISGSTGNVYTIEVKPNKISCDCPDYISHFKRYRVLCKHICFVICRICKIEDEDIFSFLEFSENHYEILKARLNEGFNDDIVDVVLSKKLETLEINKNTIITPRNMDEDCLICYEKISGDMTGLVCCYLYRNAIHKECAIQWSKTSQQNKCVICRSETLNNTDTNTSNYINIL